MNPDIFVDIAVENAKREKLTGFFGLGESPIYLINGEIVSKENTKHEKLDRINLLSSEIDANEEENRLMQAEITKLYAEIDAGNYAEPASVVATA